MATDVIDLDEEHEREITRWRNAAAAQSARIGRLREELQQIYEKVGAQREEIRHLRAECAVLQKRLEGSEPA